MSRKRKVAAVAIFVAWIAWVASFFISDELKSLLHHADPEPGRATEFISHSQDARLDCAKSLRVCTWNLNNYNINRRNVNGAWRFAPKSEEEKRMLCDTIANIKPDVLLVNEIGGFDYLSEFRSMLARKGQFYKYMFVGNTKAVSRLGILSKYPPSRTFDFNPLRFEVMGQNGTSPRGAIGAEFDYGRGKLYVFSLHLKSKLGAKKRDEKFAPFRFAEIRAIDSAIFNLAGSSPLLLGGDFNDEPAPALLHNFLSQDLLLVPQSDAAGGVYTYYWKRREKFFQYDFFMANHSMMEKLKLPASIYDGAMGSDHRPVYVDIRLD